MIYLYDLPKVIVSSFKIAAIIKEKSGYDFHDFVQFSEYKPNSVTGMRSPFSLGIIKVDSNQL